MLLPKYLLADLLTMMLILFVLTPASCANISGYVVGQYHCLMLMERCFLSTHAERVHRILQTPCKRWRM